MVDLERLDEALAEFAMFEEDGPLDWHEKPVVEAARAYRDMMANVAAEKLLHVECGEVLAMNQGRHHWVLACFRQADHNGPHMSAISWPTELV